MQRLRSISAIRLLAALAVISLVVGAALLNSNQLRATNVNIGAQASFTPTPTQTPSPSPSPSPQPTQQPTTNPPQTKLCNGVAPPVPLIQPCPTATTAAAVAGTVPPTASAIPNQVCPGNVLVPQNQSCPLPTTTNPGSGTGGPVVTVPLIRTPVPTGTPAPTQTNPGPAPTSSPAATASPAVTASPVTTTTPPVQNSAPATTGSTSTVPPQGAPTTAPANPTTPPGGACPGASNVPVTASADSIQRLPGCQGQAPITINITTTGPSADGRGAQTSGVLTFVTLTNVTVDPLDLTATAVIELQPNVQAANVQVSAGTATVQGNRIVINNFQLASGQQSTATLSLVANGSAGTAASGIPAIRSVGIDAVDLRSGARITEQSGPGGAANAAAAGAAQPAAPQLASAPGAAPAAVPAPAAQAVAAAAGSPPQAAGAPVALPRTGDRPLGGGLIAVFLLGGVLCLVASLWFVGRRRDFYTDE